jgi:bifunctional non-homologous end joining protein LigD
MTSVEVDGREVPITHADKVLFPETGFTKGQLIEYYVGIAPAMLPHVRDRPLTLRRYPDGVANPSFFEKHVPAHAPKWVRTVAVPTASGDGEVEYAVVCDLPTLIWAANLAAIEFHVPLWRVGRRRKLPAPPDFMVFDLDPGEGAGLVECCTVAGHVQEQLAEQGAEAFAKTSGSKGLQVYTKPGNRVTWDALRKSAHELARSLEGEHPDLVVSNMRKELRRGRVLIDWSQNHPSKTTVAAYSVRGRPEPTVSTPVTWEEVHACAAGGNPAALRFDTAAVLARFERHGDLFADLAH